MTISLQPRIKTSLFVVTNEARDVIYNTYGSFVAASKAIEFEDEEVRNHLVVARLAAEEMGHWSYGDYHGSFE